MFTSVANYSMACSQSRFDKMATSETRVPIVSRCPTCGNLSDTVFLHPADQPWDPTFPDAKHKCPNGHAYQLDSKNSWKEETWKTRKR